MARAKLGQNFLNDPNIVRKIVQLASESPTETILEIGPGHGILTRALSEAAGEVYAIEVDRKLCDSLHATFKDSPGVRVIRADAMTFSLNHIPHPFKVVSNLPYYISTPLMFRLFELGNRITEMTLMMQLEVAQRIQARPGNKNYSPLSIAAQYYTEPRLAFRVSRHCFRPVPKVDSAVIHLKTRQTPPVRVRDEASFFRVVKGGFSHRRKVLKNSLLDFGYSKEVLDIASSMGSIDLNRRAETLNLEEFAQLADILFELSSQNMIR